jgi:hypothetical protein
MRNIGYSLFPPVRHMRRVGGDQSSESGRRPT